MLMMINRGGGRGEPLIPIKIPVGWRVVRQHHGIITLQPVNGHHGDITTETQGGGGCSVMNKQKYSKPTIASKIFPKKDLRDAKLLERMIVEGDEEKRCYKGE